MLNTDRAHLNNSLVNINLLTAKNNIPKASEFKIDYGKLNKNQLSMKYDNAYHQSHLSKKVTKMYGGKIKDDKRVRMMK